jgi:hypothetical protein
MEKINRYTPEEVLAIFQANYLQQQQFDPEVELGENLNFSTTIAEWRSICDLQEPFKLSDYFNYFFELDFLQDKWLSILLPEKLKTIGDVCDFISENATKPLIKPVKLLGSDCQTAAIFKHLMDRFALNGIDTKAIKPSSPLEPFAKANLGILIVEANKMNPSALPPVEYKGTVFYRIGTSLFVIAFLTLIASIWVSNLIWIIVLLFSSGTLLCWIGSRFKPARTSFKGIDTFRDLINRIDQSSKVYV